MNKKKHQGEPNGDDSTESCDENQNMVECSHVGKSVDLSKLKKSLSKSGGILKDCEECRNSPKDMNEEETESWWEFDSSLWMCLKCGNQACGRSKNQHALEHFKTPHSELHSLCVNTSMWNVWCYECDVEINLTCKKKLLEAVEYLRKQSDSSRKVTSVPNTEQILDVIALPDVPLKAAKTPSALSLLPRVRGLSNLGNTCFFNSVMQCLGQTPYLLDVLKETADPGQTFTLPGGKLDLNNKNSIAVEPICGILEKWGMLTSTLAETLKELQMGRAEVYMPRMLLSKLTQRMPQFGGGDQHDSHELLRRLMEAVREEDLKRYRTVILDKYGLRKADPNGVEDTDKNIVKFYSQQAEILLPTEQVFRGVIVSTLQCQDCNHTSHRDEYFLDLSLPITEKQIPPVLRRKIEEVEDKPSKHQIKKEKRAERKKNKKQKSHRALSAQDQLYTNHVVADTNMESDSESDADVEDNIEDSAVPISQTLDEVVRKGMESGYNSDKLYNSSPDSNNRGPSPDIRVDDSGVPSPSAGRISVSPANEEHSRSSSETNIDMVSPGCSRNSPVDGIAEEFERPESRLSFVNNKNTDLKVDLEKLSLLNDGDSNKLNYVMSNGSGVQAVAGSSNNIDGAWGGLSTEDEKMDQDEADDVWTSTIAPRYQCEEGECSVQSCLNQFTTCEMMSGNNKVSCDMCTKRHGGSEKKTVYTNATKQLLIYNPPAVLILHLKRFQVIRFRSAKVSKYVKFPTLLDIAPFCSKRSRNLPTFEEGQDKVLYALYGVVEHSGSIHGGHYVAYVKVRPQIDQNDYRWQFLPKNQRADAERNTSKGAQGLPEVPTGKWFYVSDSYVSEVTEEKVLSAQAYLLFYERIL